MRDFSMSLAFLTLQMILLVYKCWLKNMVKLMETEYAKRKYNWLIIGVVQLLAEGP